MMSCGMKGAGDGANCCGRGGMKGCGGEQGVMMSCGMMGAGDGAGCDRRIVVVKRGPEGCGMGPGGPMMGRGMERGGPMGCGMGMGCDPEQMKDLGLSPDQQKRMADAHERLERQRIQTGADLRIAQLDLEKLMRAENPDRAQIEAQIDRIAGLEATMKKAHIATQLEVRSILTPEQVRRMHEGPATCGAREEAKPAKPAKAAR